MESSAAAVAAAFVAIVPETLLVVVACALLLVGPFLRAGDAGRSDSRWVWAALATIALAAILLAVTGTRELSPMAPFRLDALALFTKGVGLASGAVLLLLGWQDWLRRRPAETIASFLFLVAGVNLVGAANDLVSLFLALELVSIPTYLLLYLSRADRAACEAAAKYFLLSIFSSALVLYGMSLLYGGVGSTNLAAIRAAVLATEAGTVPLLWLVAIVFVVAGLGFRITAVPFHFYAPDVFAGTSLPMAALLASVPKLAGFIALVRLVGPSLEPILPGFATAGGQASMVLWVVAVLTMFIGNFLALQQEDLRRLLAYSSVAHAGYMLVGLSVSRPGGVSSAAQAVLFYLVVYAAMTLGLFAVIVYLGRNRPRAETIDDLAGLGHTSPILGLVAAAFLFSLTGLPPTAGFWGKLYLVIAAWSEGSVVFQVLAALLAINAAIAAWYYLRIVAVMYLRPAQGEPLVIDRASVAGIAVCAIITIGLFVVPALLRRAVEHVLV
jgi:NADH-quinone oxidoreductase subunit N